MSVSGTHLSRWLRLSPLPTAINPRTPQPFWENSHVIPFFLSPTPFLRSEMSLGFTVTFYPRVTAARHPLRNPLATSGKPMPQPRLPHAEIYLHFPPRGISPIGWACYHFIPQQLQLAHPSAPRIPAPLPITTIWPSANTNYATGLEV